MGKPSVFFISHSFETFGGSIDLAVYRQRGFSAVLVLEARSMYKTLSIYICVFFFVLFYLGLSRDVSVLVHSLSEWRWQRSEQIQTSAPPLLLSQSSRRCWKTSARVDFSTSLKKVNSDDMWITLQCYKNTHTCTGVIIYTLAKCKKDIICIV